MTCLLNGAKCYNTRRLGQDGGVLPDVLLSHRRGVCRPTGSRVSGFRPFGFMHGVTGVGLTKLGCASGILRLVWAVKPRKGGVGPAYKPVVFSCWV